MKNNNIYLGNNLDLFSKLEDESIDVVFADPPYFMQTEGKLLRFEGKVFDGVKDEWDKFKDFEEYDNFCISWIKEVKRVLKKNGCFWVIGSFQNIFRIGKTLQDFGFWIINDIVWNKSNPVPNFLGTRFVNSHETLICVVKDKSSKFKFNYKTMKKINNDKQMKSVWNIPITSGKERLRGHDNKKIHSTQKPEKLLEYVILSTSKIGDVVLDPFSGSGTTAAVSKKNGRNYIGFEIDKTYFEESLKRIEKVLFEPNDLNEGKYDIKLPLVPFKELIISGFLTTNDQLIDHKQNTYFISKNGTVIADNVEYSIHKLASILNHSDSFNGWNYWKIQRGKEILKLNDIRNNYRKTKHP